MKRCNNFAMLLRISKSQWGASEQSHQKFVRLGANRRLQWLGNLHSRIRTALSCELGRAGPSRGRGRGGGGRRLPVTALQPAPVDGSPDSCRALVAGIGPSVTGPRPPTAAPPAQRTPGPQCQPTSGRRTVAAFAELARTRAGNWFYTVYKAMETIHSLHY